MFQSSAPRQAACSAALAFTLLAPASSVVAEEAPPPGFAPLFDGKGLDAFKVSDKAREHWKVEGGEIHYDGKDTHLWTAKPYRDFVLKVDWKLPVPGPRRKVQVILPSGDAAQEADGKAKEVEIQYGGDSGIYLRGNEDSQVNIWNWPIGSGEVWGYRTNARMPVEVRKAVTPRARADKPLGEWNSFTILVKGDRLTVDLNGVNVISGATLPGVPREGPIALQHHGDPVHFRAIYIREIPESTVELFDGKSLDGWKKVAAAEDTWTVRDGMIICSGKPNGFLRTEKEYGDYVLEGEWLFAGKGGQSGLLLHTREPDKVWPPSIEVQLDHGLVGNFVKIGDVAYEGGKRSENREKPVGQWNHFRATAKGDSIEVEVNGKKVSEAKGCRPTRGTIGFQSEGVEVHMRNIWLTPIR